MTQRPARGMLARKEAAMQERITLTERNRQVHADHEECFVRFLEALTALQLEEARALLDDYSASLLRHLDSEERLVLPAFRDVHAAADKSQDPTPAHVEGDHKILRRTLAKATAALAALEQGPSLRRDMVLALDSFLLVRRVQEHHDAREQRLMYPLLDRHLDEERHALLCNALVVP